MTYAQDVFKDSYSVSQHISKKSQKCLLQEHPGPPFQIREGPGSFSNAENEDKIMQQLKTEKMTSKHFLDSYWFNFFMEVTQIFFFTFRI